MPPDGPVRLVCFDLGRVLLRICDGWEHACRVAGLPVKGDLDAEQKRQLEAISVRSDLGEIDADQFATLAAPVLSLAPQQVQKLSDHYLLRPYPGIAALLDDLRAAGVKTACLSNTNVNHWRLVNDPSAACFLPLGRLDYRFASFLIRARKPQPAIYAHAEHVSGLLGSQIAFYDDVQENIDAATTRGWRGSRIDPTGDPMAQARAHLSSLGVFWG
jgi:putative hydrolase of the HAD superfamily